MFLASLPSSIALHSDLGPEDIWFDVDEGALQDAFLNVLFNARDAIDMHRGNGKISVRLEAVQEQLFITIDDEGPGFGGESLAKASEPFFTTKPQGKGSGLGLAMVSTFLNQCSGTLDIKNRPQGGASVRLLMRNPTEADAGLPPYRAEELHCRFVEARLKGPRLPANRAACPGR